MGISGKTRHGRARMTYQLAGLLGLGHVGVEVGLGVAGDHDSLLGRHSSLLLPRWDRKLLVLIEVFFRGVDCKIASLAPHSGRPHAAFIGEATGVRNGRKTLAGGPTLWGAYAGLRTARPSSPRSSSAGCRVFVFFIQVSTVGARHDWAVSLSNINEDFILLINT
jgi:hypothetical protein